jgi:hypothetical protein
VVTTLERDYPSAAAGLAEDLPALCMHLVYFRRLRKRFRSTSRGYLEHALAKCWRHASPCGQHTLFVFIQTPISMCTSMRHQDSAQLQ